VQTKSVQRFDGGNRMGSTSDSVSRSGRAIKRDTVSYDARVKIG
jgi:hypothetical protein